MPFNHLQITLYILSISFQRYLEGQCWVESMHCNEWLYCEDLSSAVICIHVVELELSPGSSLALSLLVQNMSTGSPSSTIYCYESVTTTKWLQIDLSPGRGSSTIITMADYCNEVSGNLCANHRTSSLRRGVRQSLRRISSSTIQDFDSSIKLKSMRIMNDCGSIIATK